MCNFFIYVLSAYYLCIIVLSAYYFIQIYKKTIASKIALFSNIIAGALLTQMFLVQLAIKSSKLKLVEESSKWIWNSFNHIHYGLDVAWDVYIFLGTFLFAISIFRHPKMGKIFSIVGILISPPKAANENGILILVHLLGCGIWLLQ